MDEHWFEHEIARLDGKPRGRALCVAAGPPYTPCLLAIDTRSRIAPAHRDGCGAQPAENHRLQIRRIGAEWVSLVEQCATRANPCPVPVDSRVNVLDTSPWSNNEVHERTFDELIFACPAHPYLRAIPNL